jgi:hypothetical protein
MVLDVLSLKSVAATHNYRFIHELKEIGERYIYSICFTAWVEYESVDFMKKRKN